jgi:hypothetical protein
MRKPCDECIVLANCSHVCNSFLKWCVDTKKSNLRSHPHYKEAFISTDQIGWVNEKIKEYSSESIGFLFPD